LRKWQLVCALACVVALAACSEDDPAAPDPKMGYVLVEAFPNLTFNGFVDLQEANDGSNRLFAIEQGGFIRVFENADTTTTTDLFLNISRRVGPLNYGEKGLLSLAFDPQFPTNGHFYVYYTATSDIDSTVESRISRFTVSPPSGNSVDANTEQIILTVPQPTELHNGGQLFFDAAGYLYFSFGEGGTRQQAQNLLNLLGTVIRIDVRTLPYTIPDGNPFKGHSANREEIFAYGFRNPWRMAMDSVTGMIWLGDVGAGLWEEVNVVEVGKNYGWNCREGTQDVEACAGNVFEDPIWQHSHAEGDAVIGGFVYRGAKHATLVGKYVYSDFTAMEVWALSYDGTSATREVLVDNKDFLMSAFSVDANGTVYLCEWDGSTGPGKVYKLIEK